jgi:putative effector of murein hydrolase
VTRDVPAIHEIWVYLAGSPLLALILTLGAYQCGVMLYERANRHPLANPVAIAVLLVAAIITIIDMPYAKYFEGAQFVHFLLGSATVALAVPIYKGLAVVRGRIVPLTAALLAGGTTSIVSAVVIARMLGADEAIVGGFYAKSVTAPIAMGIAERIHVSPTLTAVFAVTTGILGAVLARYVLDFVGARAWWQRGFALGLASHGLGVSRAFSVNPEAGTYASIAMGMHGIVGAVLIPLVVPHLPL